MVDIHSATAEIMRGKKRRRKKKPQCKNIMSASATHGGHKNNKKQNTDCNVQTNTKECYILLENHLLL